MPSPPDRDGFWLFHEQGMSPIEMLVLDGHIASDDELARALGREVGEYENYWEGESCRNMTDGTYTRGTWTFLRPVVTEPNPVPGKISAPGLDGADGADV